MSKETKIIDKPSDSISSREDQDGPPIELHQEEIEEIMGTPPSIMVRVGSGMLLIIIVILVVGSTFFPSDIKIEAPAILDGGLPDIVVIAPETGDVTYHRGEGNINQGDTLILIRNIHGEVIFVHAGDSGFLEMNPLIEIKRHIHENDTIGFIWPSARDTVACIIRLTSGIGKEVKIGNRVRVAINDYPAEQYGVYETTIEYISHYNASYHAYAHLPIHMITSTGHNLNIRGYNQATVEIITQEKTVFHRLINPFKGLIKK